MKHRIDVHQNESYVEVRVGGPARVEGAELILRDVTSLPEWSPTFCILFDIQELKMTEQLDSQDIRAISDVFRSFAASLGTGCCAVVTSDAHDYGLARMWQIMSEDDLALAIRVFQSPSEAEEWMRECRAADHSGSSAGWARPASVFARVEV